MNKMKKTFLVVTSSLVMIPSLAGCNSYENVFYDVVFKNYDESVLYETSVKHGEDAVYEGSVPTKPTDKDYQYAFDGWDKPLTNITEDTTFIAQFKKTNDYVVNFYDYNGKTLLFTSYVKEGEAAKYERKAPKRSADLDHYYIFKGWDKPIDNVTSNLDVFAQYDEKSNIKNFDIDFEFTVREGAEAYDEDTTNYLAPDVLGEYEGVNAILVEPVIVGGEEVTTRHIDFKDMEFDYSKVDTNKCDEYEITVSYGGVSKKDIIDVVPDYHKWTNLKHYNFNSLVAQPDPYWVSFLYLDLFDEGAITNSDIEGGMVGSVQYYERLDEGKTLRFYRRRDGANTDVKYLFEGNEIKQYEFDDDPVVSLHCIADGGTKWVDPADFNFKIYEKLEDAPTGYGSLFREGTGTLTPRYDYDAQNKTIKIYLEGYPNPFVYSEKDGCYHGTQK